MNDQALFALPPEALRVHVAQVIRKHWIPPRVCHDPDPIPAGQVEKQARAVLDAMLTRSFRVGPLPPAEIYDQLLERVRRQVRRSRPVAVTVGYGPLKNPIAVPQSRADWAEFFALCHLVAWHNKVQAIYPPGLSLRIAFDDTTLVMANHADKSRIASYTRSVAELIRTLGFAPVLSASLRHSSFAWLFHFGLYQIARYRVRRWEQDPVHREQMERMALYASRNVLLPDGLSQAKQEEYLRAASHRYRVYWDALQLSGLTHSKKRLIAMYLDGSQHHLRQAVALHLTTLDKGQVTQPWQGVGVLVDNGHGSLVPSVLTGGRQQRYETRSVEDLRLVPGEAFERITVARPGIGSAKGKPGQPWTRTTEALSNRP